MMGGMLGSVYLMLLLYIAMLLGFAYIIWILASKETGGTKIAGQIIAGTITVLVVLMVLYGLVAQNRMRSAMSGPGMMMEGKNFQGKTMTNQQMKEMMQKYMKEQTQKTRR
ncbi:MAG: hypothetical protein PHH60_03170 [Candidatus Margulisbacteria bacterium]|nr:hypothetical protein [Candidatus Margulisiibacteriota bacterium]